MGDDSFFAGLGKLFAFLVGCLVGCLVVAVLAALALGVTLALLLFGATAEGAPAPAPRLPMPREARPSPVGVWEMAWGTDLCWAAAFLPDGRYHAQSADSLWEGSWSLKGDVLEVRERRLPAVPVAEPGEWLPPPAEHEWQTYRITLEPGALRGRFEHGQTFELRRPAFSSTGWRAARQTR